MYRIGQKITVNEDSGKQACRVVGFARSTGQIHVYSKDGRAFDARPEDITRG